MYKYKHSIYFVYLRSREGETVFILDISKILTVGSGPDFGNHDKSRPNYIEKFI